MFLSRTGVMGLRVVSSGSADPVEVAAWGDLFCHEETEASLDLSDESSAGSGFLLASDVEELVSCCRQATDVPSLHEAIFSTSSKLLPRFCQQAIRHIERGLCRLQGSFESHRWLFWTLVVAKCVLIFLAGTSCASFSSSFSAVMLGGD